MKKYLFIFIMMFLFVCPVSAQAFSDVTESDWFYKDVVSAIDNNYISGYEDGTFRPNDFVTYGEFYKMLVVAKKCNVEEEYDDNYYWAYKYSKYLSKNGDNSVITFNLDKNIKRKEVIRNVLFLFGIEDTVSCDYYDDVIFEDMPGYDIYHYNGYIQNAYQLGIIFGNNNKVNPNDYITRAEAVSIIERSLKLKDWTIPKPVVLRDFEIVYECEYAETYLEDICNAFSKIPLYIIDKMIESGSKIIVTDKIVEKNFVGLYSIDEKDIKIFTGGRPASMLFSFTNTIIHEVGHYVHYNLLSKDDEEELNKIFNDGKEVEELSILMKKDYCKTDVYEFFSELVSYFYKYGDNKQFDKIPKSYEILNKYFY